MLYNFQVLQNVFTMLYAYNIQLIRKRLSLENTKSKFQNTWASNVNISSLEIFHLTENTSSYSVFYGLEVQSPLMCVM